MTLFVQSDSTDSRYRRIDPPKPGYCSTCSLSGAAADLPAPGLEIQQVHPGRKP